MPTLFDTFKEDFHATQFQSFSCIQFNLLKILAKMAVISVTTNRSGGREGAKRGS